MNQLLKKITGARFDLVAITADEFAALKALPNFAICDSDVNSYKLDGDINGRRLSAAFALNNEANRDSVHICFYQSGDKFYGKETELEEVRDRGTKKLLTIGSSDGVFVWVQKNQSQSYDYARKFTYLIKSYVPEIKVQHAMRHAHDLGGTGHGDDSYSDADPGL